MEANKVNVEEIFSTLSAHMAKGLKIHNQLSNAFGFLNLHGYQKCHEYHFYEESNSYRDLNNFYIDNYNKLIVEEIEEKVDIIPSNWYKHIKDDVDTNTKRAAIRDLFKTWIDWEKETKTLLEKDYKDLYELNEIYGALKIAELITDVSNELKDAHNQFINLDSIGYDISLIIDKQDELYKEYHDKINKLYEDDE